MSDSRHAPEHRAKAIADAVESAWHSAHGHGRLEVPASVVAALSFLAPPPDRRAEVADRITALDTEQFTELIRQQWEDFVCTRPDLTTPAWPLLEVWHGQHQATDAVREAARAAGRAAIAAGQLELTGIRETRWEVDLFGVLLTTMRGTKSAAARGQYYTPAPVADAAASLLMEDLDKAPWVYEPTAGTGGMLRAAAQTMRNRGRDPASAVWLATDIDPLAVACAAVNSVLWELGPNVLLTVSDSLAEDLDTALERAIGQRNETLAIAERLRKYGEVAEAFQAAHDLLNRNTEL
ncbi:N-6 DNA methylase [Nocardiopsis chromatogenes]|uniref:N-6 DNA methylase n=1 Tax=Nocardiopsis chromatogenes TaxID=280239 RepID=UPI000349CD83|nr:N-6 DNA methylase [Nocardiopsis chromatogenes]